MSLKRFVDSVCASSAWLVANWTVLVVDGGDQASVPEPTTFVLAAIGLLGLLGCGRRKQKAA